MRIAVLIIALCLTMLVGLQSCTMFVGGGLAENQGASEGGAVGLLIAFLFVLGAAFALALPKLSMVCFAFAAAFGLMVGLSSDAFPDMTFWGIVAGVLAVMSYFGSRELRRKKTGGIL
jgi:hypothetical protein